jgi:hypothetical protein
MVYIHGIKFFNFLVTICEDVIELGIFSREVLWEFISDKKASPQDVDRKAS